MCSILSHGTKLIGFFINMSSLSDNKLEKERIDMHKHICVEETQRLTRWGPDSRDLNSWKTEAMSFKDAK